MVRSAASCSLVLSLLAAGCGGAPGGADPSARQDAAAASACAALRPRSLPAAPEVSIPVGTQAACSETTTSPGGEVALGIGIGAQAFVSLFTSAGAGDPDVFQIQSLVPVGGADMDPWFHFTATGWQGIAGPPGQWLNTWTADGTWISALTTRNYAWSAPDGQGGTVAVGTDVSSFAPVLSWVDADGSVRREVPLDRAARLVLVNWATGHALIIAPGDPAVPPHIANARWLDGSGQPLTPWFTTHVALGTTSMLHLLRDGRPVLANDGVWQVAFHDGSTRVDHAPAWLASRPGTRLATIPGGYAVLTDRSASTATPSVELLTAGGQSCGAFAPPPAAIPPGGTARYPDRFRVGQDGTLLESAFVTGEPGTTDDWCTTRWWPGLFARR